MAIEHVSSGPVLVNFAGTDLGFSEDGADIRYEARWGDIFSDDFGGRGGAPADTQLLGMVGSVSLQFTKYDATAVQKLSSFTDDGAADGDLPTLGTFIRQEEKANILILTGTKKTYTFNTAFPREPQTLNAGTKFTTYLVQFEFWINSATSTNFQAIT